MELEKGTLIRVHNPQNGEEDEVKKHGSLWIIERVNRHHSNRLWDAKSLATGRVHPWWEHEFEVNDGV